MGVQRHNVHHFKGLIVLNLDSRSSRAWQHFYLPPRPFEKGHFTPINGQVYNTMGKDLPKNPVLELIGKNFGFLDTRLFKIYQILVEFYN